MSDQLLSPTNIAELASVGRSVVSNWRKRYDDFPEPVGGTDSRPLFSREQVITWLTSRDYTVKTDTVAEVWSSLNVLRGVLDIENMEILVLLLFGIRQHLPDSFDEIHDARHEERLSLLEAAERELRDHYPIDEESRDALRIDLADMLERVDAGSLDPLITAIGSADPGRIAEYMDTVVSRFSRSQRFSDIHGTAGTESSRLLAALVKDVEGTIYDPAGGVADALIQVAGYRRATALVGTEVSPRALTVACLRTMARGVNISFTMGDVLAKDPVPGLEADAVIVEPPLGMREGASPSLADPRFSYGIPSPFSGELLWIQHALAHLAPGGRAYVFTTHGALRRTRHDQDVRTNLLNNGCVEAVISLSERMLSYTSIAPALWVLRNPAPAEPVLLIDARETENPADVLPDWLAGGEIDAPHSRVDVAAILAKDSNLAPAPWTGVGDVDPAEVRKSALDAAEGLAHAIDAITSSPLPPITLDDLPEPRITTVRELLARNVIERVASRPGRDVDRDDPSIIRPEHLRRQTFPPQCENPSLAAPDETEPGDVLLTTLRETYAAVDWEGDHRVAGGPVEHLRVLDRKVLTPDYLAFALTGGWNERFRTESGPSRIPLDDMEIPMIPLADQEKVGELLNRIRDIQAHARQIVQLGDASRSGILDAVRHHISL